MKRYPRFRAFMAAFCITLILLLTGIGFVVADANTRRVTLGENAFPAVDLAAWEPDRLPAWVQEGFCLLPAPVRMLCWIPEATLALPRVWTDKENAPRLPSVAARQREESY